MSLDLALNAARTGLAATQRALAETAQNIANASTDGYTRKSVAQQAVVYGDMPLGVRTGDAQRSVDAALVTRMNASRSAGAAATLRETLLTNVAQTQGVSGDGSLPDAISALQDSFIALRASPDDSGLQRSVVGAAQDVADSLNGLSGAIGDARQQAQDTIEQEVSSINSTLREIATLTARLKSGVDQTSAATLEDQRDAAVAKLSESLEVRAVRQSDGGLLLLAKGISLSPLDPDKDLLSVSSATVTAQSYYGSGGSLPGITMHGVDITSQLSGGRLGEAITLRDRTLPRMQAEVDLTATQLAGRLEAEGLALFTDAAGTSAPAMGGAYAGSAQIGFAGRITVNSTVDANPALVRDGTHAVTATTGGPTDFTPNPTGGPAGFITLLDRVLDFSFGSEAAAGSSWGAIPTSGLGPDGTLASPFLAPATLDAYATRVVGAQASDLASATSAKTDAATLTTTLAERFAKESGVDVDAELSAMVALQNAYAANARVLTTVQTMWDQLLNAVR